MARKKSRRAQGEGHIRLRADGRWEGVATLGRDPGTGKQIRKSVCARTQQDALAKLREAQTAFDEGIYIEPSKLTVGEWCDIWLEDYTANLEESTLGTYKGYVKNHIKPNLGAVYLKKLTPHQVQRCVNNLKKAGKSPKTTKNIAVFLGKVLGDAMPTYLKHNPAQGCVFEDPEDPDIPVMSDQMVVAFLEAINGHPLELLFFTDLFTGMRQGEILGLSWDNVDFGNGLIYIKQQLVYSKQTPRVYSIKKPKHKKVRSMRPARIVMEELKRRKAQQAAEQLQAGAAWNNEWNLVFTDALGGHLKHNTVYKNYKRVVEKLGEPDLTFHGMRHSYVVMSLANGDDIKTIQGNVGHHAASFMLDKYGHVIDSMKKASSERMELYINSLKPGKSATNNQ